MKADRKKENRVVSFRVKMIGMFSGIMLIVFLLIFSVVTATFTQQAERQMHFSMQQSFEQAKTVIGQKMDAISYAASTMTSNASVYAMAEKYAAEHIMEIDAGTEFREMYAIRNQINALKNMEIDGITFYLNGNFRYANKEADRGFADLELLEDTEIYDELQDPAIGKIWTVEQEKDGEKICLYSSLRSSARIGKMVGVCRITMSTDVVKGILANANVDESMMSFLCETNRDVLLTTSKLPDAWREMAGAGSDNSLVSHGSVVTIGGTEYLLYTDQIAASGWDLVLAIPTYEITDDAMSMMHVVFLALFIIFLVGLLASIFLARSMTKRIFDIVKKMKIAQKGDLSVRVKVEENDEVGQLGHAFNFFLEKINVLNQEQFYSGQAIKQAELRALRAQINPHLLYNTLDVIHWEALDYKADNIVKMTSLLARFYKLTLNSGRDFVALKDEIAHVTAYAEIQNIRFNDAVTLKTYIPEDLQQQRMPHLLLQPLVENAILHGILLKPNKEGIVSIRAELKGEHVVEIRVEDDGVGMDEETLNALTSEDAREKGYGYSNVRERMVRLYGAEHEPSVISSDKGTTIILRLPLEILLKN